MSKVPDYSTFDIETAGPLDTLARTFVTSIVVIDNDGTVTEYRSGEEDDAVRYLVSHKGIVTYNGRSFDVQILRQYVRRSIGNQLKYMPHYDLLHEWVKQRRSFNSLQNFASATLNMDKFETGGATPAMLWRTRPKEFYAYNYWDSYLTYLLFVFVCTHGYVYAKMPMLQKFFPEQIGRVTRG